MRHLEGSTTPSPSPAIPVPPYAGGHGPAHADVAPTQLGDFLHILRKRWRLIAGFALGAVVAMAIACLVMQPLYTATAVLHVENQPPQVTNIQQVAPTYLTGLEFFQDQVNILTSRGLAASLVRELGLGNDERFTGSHTAPGFLKRTKYRLLGFFYSAQGVVNRMLHGDPVANRSPNDENDATKPGEAPVPSYLVSRYLSYIQVTPITNTRMINVSFVTPNASLSQDLANAHVRQYIRRALQQKFELTGEARKFLESEIARVEREVAVAEDALNEFRRRNNVVSLDEREDAIVERLTDLGRRLTDAQATRITAEADFRLVANREYDSLPAVIGNSLIASLKNEVSGLEIRQAELGQFFLEKSPQLQEVNSQLAQARSRLQKEIGRVVGGIESVYLAAKAREDALRTEFEQQQGAVLDLKEISGQYIKLDQAVIASRNLYATLLTRLGETDVVKGVQLSNASVMDTAELPGGPSHPNVVFNLTFAMILGLALGVGLAFVLEHLDRSLKTPDDVRRVLQLPTLGVVPHFAYLPRAYGRRSIAARAAEETGKALALRKGGIVSLVADRSLHAEAYRSIRTSLLFCNPAQPPRSILVTSSQPGEGKTSTTVNLAISLSQLGNRVVVVDADLRQPRCHRALGVPAGPGLTDVLRGTSTLDQVVQRFDLESGRVSIANGAVDGPLALHVLQSGAPPADPSELLASRRMRDVLQALDERYDIVLIDSPPVFPITDAAILATVVDGVVLVVRGQRTERGITREALDRLRFMNASVVGVVLNGVDPDSSDYYQHSYYFGSERVA